MSTVRRVFFYILSLIALGILAAGLQTLIQISFDLLTTSYRLAEVGDIRQELSLGIAMLVIGGPLWGLFWSMIQRKVRGNSDEAGAAMRAFYLNFILLVAAFVSLSTFAVLTGWLLGGCSPKVFSPGDTASMIVAAGIWYYHWRVTREDVQPSGVARTYNRWYMYILSAAGLIWLSFGLVQIVNTSVISLPVWENLVVGQGFWNSGTQGNLAWVFTGAIAWWFHWFYLARGDRHSTLRQVYFYLLTILGSAVAGLIALIWAIYQVLYWVLGGGRDVTAYFQFLGWTIPAFLIALFIWLYHLNIAEAEVVDEKEQQLSARRVHFYLMSFLGLGSLIAGLIILLGIPVDWLINILDKSVISADTGWWFNELSLGLALLVVAVPLWIYYWKQVIDLVEKGSVIERRAHSRRIYLYVIVGASIVMLAADLVNIVYQLLNGALTGNLGVETLRDMKWSAQTVFVAIPVLIYHLNIAMSDQKMGAESAAVHKNVTVIIGKTATPLVTRLEDKLGYKVKASQYAGQLSPREPSLSDEEMNTLITDIASARSSNVIVVLVEGNVTVIPYI